MIAVLTASLPASRTILSISRWKASSGSPVSSETCSRSLYGLYESGSPDLESLVSCHYTEEKSVEFYLAGRESNRGCLWSADS